MICSVHGVRYFGEGICVDDGYYLVVHNDNETHLSLRTVDFLSLWELGNIDGLKCYL